MKLDKIIRLENALNVFNKLKESNLITSEEYAAFKEKHKHEWLCLLGGDTLE